MDKEKYVDWTDIFESKDDMYSYMEPHAEMYTEMFLEYLDEFKEFEGPEYILESSEWMRIWKESLEDLCENIIPCVFIDGKVLDCNDKDIKNVWNDLEKNVAEPMIIEYVLKEKNREKENI